MNIFLIIFLAVVVCMLAILLWMIYSYQLARLKQLERLEQEYLQALQAAQIHVNHPRQQLLIENLHKYTCSKIKRVDQVTK